MDSREIYERITNKYFSKITYVRAQWEFSQESEGIFPRNDIVCSIDSKIAFKTSCVKGENEI